MDALSPLLKVECPRVALAKAFEGVLPVQEILGESASPVWSALPSALQGGYLRTLVPLLVSLGEGRASPLQTMKAILALGWEMSCVRQALNDNETLSPLAARIKKKTEGFRCYKKDQSLSDLPQRQFMEKVIIQNDVPVLRSVSPTATLPYVVEAKSAYVTPFGQKFGLNKKNHLVASPDAANQVLRYQHALDCGWVSGVTMEIMGRIHPQMLEWMLSGLDGKGTRIPGVEIIWSLPLPSGKMHRVVLKPGMGEGRGGSASNSLCAPEDEAVIRGWKNLQSERERVKEIVFGALREEDVHQAGFGQSRLLIPVQDANGRLVRPFERPWDILDVPTFLEFAACQRQKTIASLEKAGQFQMSERVGPRLLPTF